MAAPSPSVIPREFQVAHTLPQLLTAAQMCGYEEALKAPANPILDDPRLEPKTRTFLTSIAQSAVVQTVRDLLEPGRIQGALGQLPLHQRARLVDVARQHIVSTPPPVRPKEASPTPAASPRLPLTESEQARRERAADRLREVPRSERALLNWAGARGVTDLLRVRVVSIPQAQGRSWPPFTAQYDIDDAILKQERGSFFNRIALREISDELQTAAWEFLQQEAELVRVALAAERADKESPPPPVTDEILQQLVLKLEAARVVMRSTVFPRATQDKGEVGLSEEPLAIRVRPPRLPWERMTCDVVLPLERWRDGPLLLRCSCTRNEWARDQDQTCRHVLWAADCLLHVLRSKPDGEICLKLGELLRQPAWARVLKSLDAARARLRPRADAFEGTRLAWKVEVEQTHVALVPLLRKPLKRGGYGVGSRMSWVDLVRGSEAWSPADRRVIATLFPTGRTNLTAGSAVPRDNIHRALAQLAGNPEVLCGECDKPLKIRTVRLGMVAEAEAGDAFTLVPAAGDEPLDFEDLFALAEDRRQGDLILRFDHECHELTMVEADDDALALVGVFAQRQVPFPAESFADLFQRAQALQERLPIALPPALRGEEIPPAQTIVIRLKPLPEGGLVAHVLARPLDGGTTFPPGEGPAEVLGTAEGRRVHVRRALAAEIVRAREWVSRLELRPEAEGPECAWTLESPDEALDLVGRLQNTPDPTLVVEWPDRPPRVSRPVKLKNVRMQVTQGKDWFGLEGEAQIDDARIELAVLLDALRRRRRYVQVRDGMWVALSEQLREKLTPLADQASGNDRSATLGLAGALAVEDIAAEVAEFEAVAGFSKLLERIRTARASEPAAPTELAPVLRDYQVAGYKWLARLSSWGAGAVLADDMGLGKTIQALALLSERASLGPTLVVAPTSVCGNWMREAERFAPSLRRHLYRDIPPGERGTRIRDLGPGDLLVTSYGLLVRDIERLTKKPFGTLVLDESQAIKNADTLRAKAARSLQAEFKLALTGTPLENHLGELWSLYRVIFPGLFGSWDEFRDRFVSREEPADGNPKTSPRATLARQLRPFLLRRTKQEVAPELPPRTEMEERIELSPAERRLYEDARLAAVAKLTGVAVQPAEQQRFEVLAMLTRLRLCASHPALYDPTEDIPSSKLNRFLEIVSEITEEKHRALVFSQFTKHLALVREALDKRGIQYLYLDGQTPPGRRDELVDAFQSGAAPLFLISLKAGGTGLNLTGADYVIHLDPWWNPAVEDQATDRAHRIGQTRPVAVLRLVAKGTIEEQILSLHATKRNLVADVLEGADAAARVSTSELIDLIRSGAAARLSDETDLAESAEIDSVSAVAVDRGDQGSAARAEARNEDSSDGRVTAPGWIYSDDPTSDISVRSFRDWMLIDLAAGSVTSYMGALRRFMAYAQREHAAGRWDPSVALEAHAERYLDGVRSGAIQAPRTHLLAARSVLVRLQTYLEERDEEA
jgi:hypothetical protein